MPTVSLLLEMSPCHMVGLRMYGDCGCRIGFRMALDRGWSADASKNGCATRSSLPGQHFERYHRFGDFFIGNHAQTPDNGSKLLLFHQREVARRLASPHLDGFRRPDGGGDDIDIFKAFRNEGLQGT